jgi:hypothetical protein
MSLLVWLLKNEQQLCRHWIDVRLARNFSEVRVHEMTEVSVEFVGGRISGGSRSSRQPAMT